MKLEKTVEVPATSYTEIQYVCEEPGCGAVRGTEDAYASHMKSHVVTRIKGTEKTIDYTTYYRIETEEDFKTFSNKHFKTYEDETTWEGPNWYMFTCGSRPCRRGCCTDEFVRSTTASYRAYELEQDIETFEQKVESLRLAIAEFKLLCGETDE